MKRKEFLKKTIGAGISGIFLPQMLGAKDWFSSSKMTKISILHTNDQHSRIEPFDASYTRNPNQGGFARRAYLINEIRKKEKNVLLFDSGDIFQGTPYFNLFGGELEFKLMSLMKYDAATMGNHDFDNGLEGFLKVLPNAKFPFITSNYDFKNTILEGKTFKYKIFKKDGIRIGVMGLGIELEGLVGKKQYGQTQYLNPVEVANFYADFLKKEKKCHLVVCLSHLGYQFRDDKNKICDRLLAPQTKNIDVILGGHTHTFLPEPQQVMNLENRPVWINQVGWAGLMLGKIDFYFDLEKNIQKITYANHCIDERLDAFI